MSDYQALKAYGHSPFKAAEIALDAKRGEQHARAWVAAARQPLTDDDIEALLAQRKLEDQP